mmetsp:Transcript_16141/g.52767  ORF Transcript_16141/g.52767 Transcript_16141/m.52767 type:complete len:176 (+) Transcript_16141:60-587(+)
MTTPQHLAAQKEDGVRARRFSEALERMRAGESVREDLSSCGLQDTDAAAIAEGIKSATNLTALDLYDNKIGDKGIIELAEAIATSKSLRILSLKWNHFGARNVVGGLTNDEGLRKLAAELKGVKKSPLEQINLEWNTIWEDGKKALAPLQTQKLFIAVDGGLPNTGPKPWGFDFQ